LKLQFCVNTRHWRWWDPSESIKIRTLSK
jgi:hypothetical protein